MELLVTIKHAIFLENILLGDLHVICDIQHVTYLHFNAFSVAYEGFSLTQPIGRVSHKSLGH